MIRLFICILIGIFLNLIFNKVWKGGDIMPIVDCYVALIVAGRRTISQVKNLYIRKLVKEELTAMGLEELAKEDTTTIK